MSSAGEESDQVPLARDGGWTRFMEQLLLDESLSTRLVENEQERIYHGVQDRRLRQQHLESLKQLKTEIHDILHHCRLVVDFDRWISRPGQAWLFARYCSLAYAQWDEAFETGHEPPIFQNVPETLERHLSHCSFCTLVRRLAEGRQRQCDLGLGALLRGDQVVDDLVSHVARDAVFHAQAPTLPLGGATEACPKFVASSGQEPTTMALLPEGCRPLNGHLLVPIRLTGGGGDIAVEVNVTWHPAAGPSGDAEAQLAFPNQQNPDPIVTLDASGSCELTMLVPRTAAREGLVVKYCGHCFDPDKGRQLVSFGSHSGSRVPTATTRGRRIIRTRGADRSPAISPASEHSKQNQPPEAHVRFPVRVASLSFQWD